ncbi:MAG: hypothetical protein GY729_12530, partial [Desulfobacteraceae bacterium]|nr:hypothetical protein [Desulfobacteraceae bacterium]
MISFLKIFVYKFWWLIGIVLILVTPVFIIGVSESVAASESAFLKDIGMKNSAAKIVNLKQALFWEARAFGNRVKGAYDWQPEHRVYGNLYSLDRDTGALYFQYYQDGEI